MQLQLAISVTASKTMYLSKYLNGMTYDNGTYLGTQRLLYIEDLPRSRLTSFYESEYRLNYWIELSSGQCQGINPAGAANN